MGSFFVLKLKIIITFVLIKFHDIDSILELIKKIMHKEIIKSNIMKISTIVFTFLFFIQISFSQNNSNQKPPKKTWKILIRNDKSSEENFTLVGKTIVENDFQIEKKDKEFLSIQTSAKNLEKLNALYYFNLLMKDSLIILTGMSKINLTLNYGGVTSESSYDKIINKGMSGSIARESFNEMWKFALLIPKSEYEFITD